MHWLFRSIFHGRYSPAPLGVAGVDRVLSFRSVLRLVREFHGVEGLASWAPIGCELTLAPISGLLSESFRLFPCHPLSPLLRPHLGDSTLALSLFLGDYPCAGFIPVPDCLRRKVLRNPPPLYLVRFSPARAVPRSPSS